MFKELRDPNGRFTPLASAVALFVLAALSLPLMRTRLAVVPLGLLAAGVVNLVLWNRSRQRDKYDLRSLFDSPPPDDRDEPYLDAIPNEEVSAPYCGWCDECYPPGTQRCRRCNRALG